MRIVRGSAVNWVFVGPVLISFHQPGVQAERWQRFIATMREAEFTHYIAAGFGPIERRAAEEASVTLKNKRVVVILDHTVARRIATVLGWFGKQIKGFDWTHVHEAIEYLQAPGIAPDALAQAVYDLRDASVPMDGLTFDSGSSALRSD